MLLKQTCHQIEVANIAVHKEVSRVISDRLQTAEVAGVGQLVQVDDPRRFALQPISNKICAYESGTASDENGFFSHVESKTD
jgi:hypothetical protein